MTWIVLLIYIGGVILTHYLLYRINGSINIEVPMLNIISFLWPVSLAIWCVLTIESFFVKS